MAGFVRKRPILLAALVLIGALAGSLAVVGPGCSELKAALQWRLDVERAMDAVGLASGMVVGESGAGDGYFTIPMSRRVGPTGAVYANDISQRALRSLAQRAAREGLANVQTVVGEVDDPLFPRRDLELVVLVHAFHDFARPVEWLVNLKKYLRPGGTVAIIDRDPAQGTDSHFLPRQRIEQYASDAGYGLARASDDIRGYLILVFRPN